MTVNRDSSEFKTAESSDLAWKVSRKTVDDHQSIPSWTASNAFLSEQNLPVATTCYLPFIRAPPTDLTAIYTILQIAEKLDQSHILVTADCAIYSKAQHILWNKPPLLDGKVTMRLGGMQLNMAYIASIGKLYGDGGLLSMLVDSDVYAPATARLMFEEKQVSRGNRGMKLMLEALYRLYQEAFWAWIQQRDQTDLRRNDMDKLVRDIQQAFASWADCSTTIQTARVRTHRHLTGATTGVHSCWKDAIGYIRVLGDVHAGSGDVAATSESRAGWHVRTVSHRCLRDHSLVSSCRQRQLRQIFAWISEWYGNSAAETTKVLPISARWWICFTFCLPGDSMPLLLTKRLNRQ